MRLSELLALLGRAWAPLLLYPGGLGLLLALALLRRPGLGAYAGRPRLAELSAAAAPWLGLALLPLPLAPSIGRTVDLLTLVALLEWPRLLLAAQELRAGDARRMAALLNSYPLLLASALLLAAPSGSLTLAALAQAPGDAAGWPLAAAHWLGAAGLLAALAPLLGLGPFGAPQPERALLRLGLALRCVGWCALAALPWAALVGDGQPWLLPLPALAVAGAAWAQRRLGAGRAALPWARGLLWLSAALLAALAAAAAAGLADTLR